MNSVIFSGQEVLGVLDGSMTSFVRPMKPQPPEWCERFGVTCFTPPGHISGRGNYRDEGPAEKFFRVPFGQPGERIIVKEMWRQSEHGVLYRADHRPVSELGPGESAIYWNLSVTMPEKAARLILQLTTARACRLEEALSGKALETWRKRFIPGNPWAWECGFSVAEVRR